MEFAVKNRIITKPDGVLIGDNADYSARFVFDEEWNGDTKTARFERAGKFVDVLLKEDACIIPIEILKKGTVDVGVFSAEKTTNICRIYILESIKEKEGSPVPKEEDVYSQILDKLDELAMHGVSDEQIGRAVSAYLTEHPISSLTEEDVQTIIQNFFEEHKEELKGQDGQDGKDGVSVDQTEIENIKKSIEDTKKYVDEQIGGAINAAY